MERKYSRTFTREVVGRARALSRRTSAMKVLEYSRVKLLAIQSRTIKRAASYSLRKAADCLVQ